jgi:hypothetical protein
MTSKPDAIRAGRSRTAAVDVNAVRSGRNLTALLQLDAINGGHLGVARIAGAMQGAARGAPEGGTVTSVGGAASVTDTARPDPARPDPTRARSDRFACADGTLVAFFDASRLMAAD